MPTAFGETGTLMSILKAEFIKEEVNEEPMRSPFIDEDWFKNMKEDPTYYGYDGVVPLGHMFDVDWLLNALESAPRHALGPHIGEASQANLTDLLYQLQNPGIKLPGSSPHIGCTPSGLDYGFDF
ncbi:unnamed protein product [Fraxinus pennsylvanica]|uniref:Uncharacterized protein n=1 Tax=Fraxinus pennsylvanica TaxID=56036 RepID=A0AAD1Z691_9LAMI|nr:unnamed protein product [Fraxinus pennsylvanica]